MEIQRQLDNSLSTTKVRLLNKAMSSIWQDHTPCRMSSNRHLWPPGVNILHWNVKGKKNRRFYQKYVIVPSSVIPQPWNPIPLFIRTMFVDLQVFLNYSAIFCSNAYFPPNLTEYWALVTSVKPRPLCSSLHRLTLSSITLNDLKICFLTDQWYLKQNMFLNRQIFKTKYVELCSL